MIGHTQIEANMKVLENSTENNITHTNITKHD